MEQITCLDLRGNIPRRIQPPPRTVLCLGNFDGVHIAHTALLAEGIRLAQTISEKTSLLHTCGVFCFVRPTADYAPRKSGECPVHLTTLRDKLTLLAEGGAEIAFLCEFPAVKELSPEAFIQLLKNQCHCHAAVCGYNHRFGRGAQGTHELLARHFGKEAVTVLPAMELCGEPISSSRIRSHLSNGEVEDAARLLGRPYSLSATVIHGKGLGHKLGFPTANQYFPAEQIIPKRGVYAVLCHTPDGVRVGVANVGCHPTVDARARVNCETYIPHFDGDLYGYRMKVEFLSYLRPEQKFASLDELTAAIRRDAEQALNCFSDQI